MILRLGTLGSAATFAGEATQRMRELYPEFGEPAYFPSMEACWDALKHGSTDVIILGVERTGQSHHGEVLITKGFYVMGALAQPLQCNLYAKPGTVKSNISAITGHGSVQQCTAYLDREYPGVPRERHGLNSVEAAKSVMAADCTMAVVGTKSLPQIVPGLELLAAGIDGGAVASWWAVTAKPVFSNKPRVLVVTGCFGPDGRLGDLVARVAATGFRLVTAASFAVKEGVSIYDYLLTFRGAGSLDAVREASSAVPGARLAAANEPRG